MNMFDELRKRIEEKENFYRALVAVGGESVAINGIMGSLNMCSEVIKWIDQLEAECGVYEAEIRNKALDEFAEKLHDREFDNAYGTNIVLTPKEVDEIAQQLKEE